MATPHQNHLLLYAAALLVATGLVVGVSAPTPTRSIVMLLLASFAGAVTLVVLGFLRVRGSKPTDTKADLGDGHHADLELAKRRLSLSNRLADMGQFQWRLGDDSIWWSPELCDIYGVSRDAAPGTLAETFAYIHPDDRSLLRGLAAEARESRTVAQTQFRIKRPDGGVRCIAAMGWLETHAGGDWFIEGVQRDITRLASARRKLQLADAQYRFLFEHAPMAMWVFDRQSQQLLAVNEQTARQYGDDPVASREAPSLAMLDFSPVEAQQTAREARSHVANSKHGEIWTHRRHDGIQLRAALFSQDIDFDGRAAQLIAALDVTDQERNRTLLQLVADATSDAIYEWDIERNALWISDSFFRVFGSQRPTFAPTMESWKRRIHASDAPQVIASLEAAMAGDAQGWESEYAFSRGDGSYATVLHRGFFLRDSDGRAVRMVGGLIDLTEKHRVAADLRLLRRAVESTNTGIVITEAPDNGQPIVFVNSGFEAITGYAAEDVIGLNIRFLQGDENDQPGVEAITNAIAEERELRVTLKNFRKDGEVFWSDFHLSPLHDESGRLTHYMGVITDVTERHRYEEQLAHRATHDDLTGIANRQLVIDLLNHAINSARRLGGTVTVLFIDLDDFKAVNDTMGHAAGDAVLRTVAERLAGLTRGTDTAGRFGGDEFVLILEDQESQSNVEQVIERVARTLSAPMDIEGVAHSMTLSIGHCRYPQDGGTADALLLNADIAMYHAKRRGRNRAVAYSPDFDDGQSLRRNLVPRLREALDRNEFVLVFQPLFRASGQPAALEALVRWNHPEKGELLPSEFIDVCETAGLIQELECSVLAAAAGYHHQLVAAGLGHIRIAVNISPTHFIHDLYADVESIVNKFNLPRGSLELELTESVIMENPDRTVETMARLATLGVSSTVDDFGTGYSSLAYLKRLPIERVKIDRAFVRDLRSDLSDRSICESIISLAKSMNLRTVAEGVETDFQLSWLKGRGVDEFQGHLLGWPAPFEQVIADLTHSGFGR